MKAYRCGDTWTVSIHDKSGHPHTGTGYTFLSALGEARASRDATDNVVPFAKYQADRERRRLLAIAASA